jgi:hypothetical protein
MRLLVGSAMILAWVTSSAMAQAGAAPTGHGISFSDQVRPILARHCFKCHGPDEKARKARLRLDLAEEATKPAGSGERPIAPGQPDESELVRRIFAEDPTELMPPAAAKLPLAASDRDVLKRWIAEGARYEAHWAFQQPARPRIPQVRDLAWVKNPIDAFVMARLDAFGLRPSPIADRATLLRRVSLDLVGLPPTPDEVDAFLADPSPDAYEKQVDRLLASPHYGERWARKWLDLARYADTNGYEKDRQRSIWPYRDWVIRAINADKPFDQFTIEQLAGDMLEGASPAQKVATGFHRNTMLNEEGGIDPLEFRFYAMIDRVNTTATVWLGLTLGCAQCHTHKFDPIPQRDYYQFMALLNNADEPEMVVRSLESDRRRREMEAQIAALVDDLPKRFPTEGAVTGSKTQVRRTPAKSGAPASTTNASGRAKTATPTTLTEKSGPAKAGTPATHTTKSGPAEAGTPTADEWRSGPAHAGTPAAGRREYLARRFREWAERASADAVRWTLLEPLSATSNLPHLSIEPDGSILASGDQSKRDVYTIRLRGGLRGITGIRLEALPDERLPNKGPGRVYYEGPFGDFFLSEFRLTVGGKPVSFKEATATHPKAPNAAAPAIDGDPQTGWSIGGGQGREQRAVFRLAKPLDSASELTIELLFERYYAAGLGRFRISATTDTRPLAATDTPHEIESILLEAPEKRRRDEIETLRRYYLMIAPELAKERGEIDRLKSQLKQGPTTLVLKERPPENPRPTFIHKRGEFLQPAERVEPAVLSMLPSLPASAPRNRLSLARWLVSGANPLTGRVTMNRQWAAFFGRGLVRTVEDFGYQGERPTHPELLDWLGIALVDHGWSMKAMHRLIVTSATYQQSSHVTPELLAKDPENRLLARGPRVRLDAEIIRDSALLSSGLLSEGIGGPSVFPPQPPSVTTEGTYGGLAWTVSPGRDRYRRGLYTFTKRTAPYAMFTTFDGPSGEVCVARREVSDSPLQALTLLNDIVFEDAAAALGRMMASSAGSAEARASQLFRRCLARKPDRDELAMLVRFSERQRQRLATGELDAVKIGGPGEGDATERAVWTILARAILNLDEAVTKG